MTFSLLKKLFRGIYVKIVQIGPMKMSCGVFCPDGGDCILGLHEALTAAGCLSNCQPFFFFFLSFVVLFGTNRARSGCETLDTVQTSRIDICPGPNFVRYL